MPSKRDVLDFLTRQELLDVVERQHLSVRDREARDALIDAIDASSGTTVAEVLANVSGDRLKEVGRKLGLGSAGRDLGLLVAKLGGAPAAPSAKRPVAAPASAVAPRVEPAAKAPAEKAPAAKAPVEPAAKAPVEPAAKAPVEKAPAAKARVEPADAEPQAPAPVSASKAKRAPSAQLPLEVVIVPGEPLTVDKLAEHLAWAAALLGPSVPAPDRAACVIGLLFLKRVSDLEDAGERLPGLTLSVPRPARWSEIARASGDAGGALYAAGRALEEKNPELEGVLTGIGFGDAKKLADGVLARLVQHFSKLALRTGNLAQATVIDDACERLIEALAGEGGKKGSHFYTPHVLVDLLVNLLAPEEGMQVCDPMCGAGGVLLASARYVERAGGKARNLSLYGQERDIATWSVCKLRLRLRGLDARVEHGDTIREPKLVSGRGLMIFDRVIACPPFSHEDWGYDVAASDSYGRFDRGAPPSMRGDLAFVQHMVATLNDEGRLGVVLPQSVLARGSIEKEIRQRLIEEDLVEVVISLSTTLFGGASGPVSVVVMNRDKARARAKRVLFIDAAHELPDGSPPLRNEDIAAMAQMVRAFADLPGFTRVASLAAIARHGFDLTARRYVETTDAVDEPPPEVSVRARTREIKVLRSA